MRICRKCGEPFPFMVSINGKQRNLCSRYFCLTCSPFGRHNTKDLTKPTTKNLFVPKKCSKCGLAPPAVSFYATSRTSYCKKCFNRNKLENDIALKKKAIEYKGGRCFRCGYVGHYAAFQFHHLRDKQMVWNMMRNTGWDKVRPELDKCELVCANCHHIIHSKNMHH